MGQEIHVYPINDETFHKLNGTDCACSPKLQHINGSTIVIHRSWDGREIDEAKFSSFQHPEVLQ